MTFRDDFDSRMDAYLYQIILSYLATTSELPGRYWNPIVAKYECFEGAVIGNLKGIDIGFKPIIAGRTGPPYLLCHLFPCHAPLYKSLFITVAH